MLNKKSQDLSGYPFDDEDDDEYEEGEDLLEAPVQKEQVPDWYNPTWLPKDNPDFESDEEASPFEIEELPAQKPVQAPAAKETDFSDSDNAMNLLAELSVKYPNINEITDVVFPCYEQMLLDEDENQKIELLSLSISKLLILINNPTTIQEGDRANVITSAKAIYKVLEDYVKTMPQASRETLTNKLSGKIKTPKVQAPEFKSKYYGPDIIFIRNRAIKIAKNENVTIEEAEKKSKEEWDSINQIINEIAANKTEEEKTSLKTVFATQVLGDTPFDEAKQFITDYISIGRTHENVFEDVEVEPDDWQDFVGWLSDKELIEGRLSAVPDENKQVLANKIMLFGKYSSEIGNISQNYIEGMEIPGEVIEHIQDLYEKISAIGQFVLSINPEILKSDEIFEWIYIILKNMSSIVSDIGIDTLSVAETSGAALEASKLSLRNPSKQKPEKGMEGPPRERDKETDDKAREAYLQRIEKQNRMRQYLDDKLKRREQKPEDETEKRRIRTHFWDSIKKSVVKWNYLSHLAENQNAEIGKLQKKFAKDVLDLFTKMKQSWLPQSALDKMEKELLYHCTYEHSKLLELLQKDPSANKFAIKSLAAYINTFSNFFSQAKEQISGMDIPKLQNTKKKISTIVDMVDKYCKFANMFSSK